MKQIAKSFSKSLQVISEEWLLEALLDMLQPFLGGVVEESEVPRQDTSIYSQRVFGLRLKQYVQWPVHKIAGTRECSL